MIAITYVRASTLLVRFPGLNLLTDPWFRNHLRGLPCFKRPGIPLGSLPPVDAVAASHLHPDHFDTNAVRQLAKGFGLRILGPQGTRRRCRRMPSVDVAELSPWETIRVGKVRVTATEAVHSGVEINFVFEIEGRSVFFGGDCRFCANVFRGIAARFSLDVAILPVGGTLVLGRRIVMGPRDALEAVRILKPRYVIPIHEGGIWMSVPPLSLHPGRPEHLVHLVEREGLGTRVVILRGGETFHLDA